MDETTLRELNRESYQMEWDRRADILQQRYESGVITLRQFETALSELVINPKDF